MGQFCVFCGERPTEKTGEHVIPRWLIELTGDPNRQAIFGPFWNDDEGHLDVKPMAFDQFVFPACAECNNEFSALEAEAKRVVESLLQALPLSSKDFSTLLTWLDRVRIGVWLGSYYLHREVSDIEPHMFITDRMNRTDRLVLIYIFDEAPKRLVLTGNMTPAFLYSPCCFSLLINGVALVNVATDFVLSKRLGLPYPIKVLWEQWPRLLYKIVPGKEHISLPLLRTGFDSRCTQICQPMFRREIIEGAPFYYETDYVKSMTEDWATGTGRVLVYSNKSLRAYPGEPSSGWVPTITCEAHALRRIIGIQVFQLQMYLMNQDPEPGACEPDRQAIVRRQNQLARAWNRHLIEEINRTYYSRK